MQIKKAVRKKIWLKVAITGPTGSGKTFGALGIAKGLSTDGRVCVIDTENASASYYAGQWDFDVIELSAPFSPEKYLEAFRAAVDAGYSVVVIDSLSHEWDKQGGILDQKAKKDQRGGNGFANWQEYKAVHGSFVDVFLGANVHIIATIRSKMAYEQEEYTEAGQTKKKIVKLGLAPVQSDGIEYEFGVVFDLAQKTHMAESSKDRTGLFDKRTFLLNEAVGKELKAWRDGGAELKPESSAQKKSFAQLADEGQEILNKQWEEGIAACPSPPPTKAQATEDAKDSFIEDVDFVSARELAKLQDLTTTHRIPMDKLLRYLADKGHVLPTEGGELRLSRLKAASYSKIHDIFADGKRRHAFVAALTSEPQTA